MNAQFIEQVENLMQMQRRNEKNKRIANSKYYWLCNRKIPTKYLTSKEEYNLYFALNRVSQVDKVNVLNHLRNLIDTDGNIPEIATKLLNKLAIDNYVRNVTFTRMNSFRSSLRKFSSLFYNNGNRIVPDGNDTKRTKRSVSFNDHPTVYSIT